MIQIDTLFVQLSNVVMKELIPAILHEAISLILKGHHFRFQKKGKDIRASLHITGLVNKILVLEILCTRIITLHVMS